MEHLTVATRGGALAIVQTKTVIALLKNIFPELQVEIKEITTSGDSDRRTALWNLKDTGFFTSQIEDALLASQADFAVHSFKDLPTQQQAGLKIAAVCDRKFVEDCLLCNRPIDSVEQLPKDTKVGTSSLRRAAQLKHMHPDIDVVPIRGNVKTRIKKLEAGDYDAIVLARAGLERLGLGEKISFVFDPTEFIPAPAQGALAVQTRADDKKTNEIVAAINDKQVEIETAAERKILTVLQCGCHTPVGAFAKIKGEQIKIHAFISDLKGKKLISRMKDGFVANANSIAENLAKELLTSGGKEILQNIK
jgi:hydroxymethylbilane synthase